MKMLLSSRTSFMVPGLHHCTTHH